MGNKPFLLGSAPQTQQGTIADVVLPDSAYYASSVSRGYETGLVGHTVRWLNTPTSGPNITKQQAEQELTRFGVTFDIPDEGMPKDKFQYLAERQVYMKQLESDQERRRASGMTAAVGFGAGMASELINPINYIPVIGPSRWAATVGAKTTSLGRFGARAGLGAVEASAATAITEPSNYYFAQQLGDDYTVYDSIANVMTGAAFGAGLSGGAGIFADAFNFKSGVLNGVSRSDREFITQKAAERLLRDGDVDVAQIVDAAAKKNTLMTPAEAVLSPDLRRKMFEEGPNAVKREIAASAYFKDKPEVKQRLDVLTKAAEGLDRISKIQKYKDALDLPDNVPNKQNIIDQRLSELETKYGPEIADEIKDIEVYKQRMQEMAVTTNSNKLRRLKLENEKLDAKYDGRLKVAASKDVNPTVQRDIFQSEINAIRSSTDPDIDRVYNDMNNAAYKEWETAKQEFSVGQTRTGIDETNNQNMLVDKYLEEGNARISDTDDMTVLQNDIDGLKQEVDAFEARTGIKTGDIEDVNIEAISVQSKNYARCLLR